MISGKAAAVTFVTAAANVHIARPATSHSPANAASSPSTTRNGSTWVSGGRCNSRSSRAVSGANTRGCTPITISGMASRAHAVISRS